MKGNYFVQFCFFSLASFFTITLVLIANKLLNNEVSNFQAGTTILASCLLSAPFFYLCFFASVGFGFIRVSIKNYFFFLASFTGLILFIYVVAFFLNAIKNLRI